MAKGVHGPTLLSPRLTELFVAGVLGDPAVLLAPVSPVRISSSAQADTLPVYDRDDARMTH